MQFNGAAVDAIGVPCDTHFVYSSAILYVARFEIYYLNYINRAGFRSIFLF